MRAAADAAGFGSMLLHRLGRSMDPPAPVRQRIVQRVPAAAAVLAPDSPDAIAEVLGICTAEGWPVRVAGAATRLRRESRPVVVVSTCRLTEVTEHEPADLVAGVAAGMGLGRLGDQLGTARQWLPLDPPGTADGTLGAALATDAAGPLRAAHGTARDMALGVEVVTGDGRRLRFGGRVVKNVAGYDAVRLLVGSRGRLGVITHAFVRLRGLPRVDTTLTAPVAGAGPAAELALSVRDRLTCDALELIAPGAAVSSGTDWLLAARFTGSEPAVAASVSRLRSIVPAATPLTEPQDFWHDLSRAEAEAETHECMTVPPSDLPDRLERLFSGGDPGWSSAAHVTAGVIRVWRRDGSAHLFPRAPRPSEREETLTRHLCAVFDPAGILQTPEAMADG